MAEEIYLLNRVHEKLPMLCKCANPRIKLIDRVYEIVIALSYGD